MYASYHIITHLHITQYPITAFLLLPLKHISNP
jgi:hypothetical protein